MASLQPPPLDSSKCVMGLPPLPFTTVEDDPLRWARHRMLLPIISGLVAVSRPRRWLSWADSRRIERLAWHPT
jgi:hypothetical protein